MHPAIAALDAHRRRVNELSGWLGGAEFADERGWLKEGERARFERERRLFAWTQGALDAHADRVRLDHPAEYAAWIRQNGLKMRPAPRWRLDRVEQPPRGDLFEMELRVTWWITKVETGDVVLEIEGCTELEYKGPGWESGGGRGVTHVRIARDHAHILRANDTEEHIPLL